MKGVFIQDVTVEMLRKAPLEGVEDLLANGMMKNAEHNEWIPCSERLPEEFEHVLTCDDYRHIHMMCFIGYTKDGTPIWTSIEDDRLELYGWTVAWMPLPEPYKGVK